MSTDMPSGFPPVVAIYGATGSGKTDVAVHVARMLGTEVINCDPQQCYRGLPILTNQPVSGHDAIAPHRLIGCWGLDHEANVADFAARAHAEVDDLIASTGHAVLCSGSGLYLLSALAGLTLAGGAGGGDQDMRQLLEREYESLGAAAMHDRLSTIDPRAAHRIHPNDRKRIIRAFEVAGRGASVAEGTMWDAPLRHDTAIVGLRVDRTTIRRRIDERTMGMFEAGLLGEVVGICGEDGSGLASLSSTAQRIHGLQDFVDILAGAIGMEEGIDRQAARTRQYAKRQDTWARRWPGLRPMIVGDGDRPDAIARLVLELAARAPVRGSEMQEHDQ